VTGAETAAAAAAKAAAAAAKAAAEDSGVKKELLALAKETPAMQAAAESYAKRIAIRQAVMLKLFSPLARWMGIRQEYFQTDFPEEMAARTAHIPEDQLVTPAPSLAVPAIEGLGYSVDEPSLREMYLNLLAAASNSARVDEAHPSFPNVVKQLSAAEAALLLDVLSRADLPVAKIHYWATGAPHGGYHVMATNLLDASQRSGRSWQVVAMWIDNWVRLGLVEISWVEHITNPAAYAWAENGEPFAGLQQSLKPEVGRASLEKGVLRVTSLGRRFASAVGPDPALASAPEPEGENGEPEART
jgi:hypothetical protein